MGLLALIYGMVPFPFASTALLGVPPLRIRPHSASGRVDQTETPRPAFTRPFPPRSPSPAPQLREDLFRRRVRDLLVDHLLVAVDGEVVALGDDVRLRKGEAPGRAGTLRFLAGAPGPASEDVGEVVLRVAGGGERLRGNGVELLVGEERGPLVVERPAVGVAVVEPDVVGAAGVRLRAEEDGGRDTGVRLEDAAGEGDDGVELLLLDQDLPERPVGGPRTEEDAVGDDDGGAAPGLQEP